MSRALKMRGFRVILCMIVVLVVGFLGLRAWMFPKYEPPMPSGEYNVETALYTWEDPDRKESFTQDGSNRKVTVKFWYPKQEGTYPLVVFSHGAFGVIDSNYSTCAELASRGYVVASIAHPYHAMYVEDVEGKKTYVDSGFMKAVLANDGSYTEEGERKSYEQSLEWMELRTKDMNFVLDTILSTGNSALFSMIDPEKIGLMGHSLGGATAVEVGRNRNDIRAVIDLEGTMLGEYAGFENGFEGVVFIGVYVVLWIDDTRNAEKFNAKLKELQQQEKDR